MGVNNSLLKSMQTIVDKAIDVAPFDKTRQAQVVTNNNDGTYDIRLDGILYNNIPSYPNISSIIVGSVVKIIVPSNQYSQMYIQSSNIEGDGDPIGSIIQYAGAVEPDGWFICNGRELSRETYADLFNAIGTAYGDGDGSTTFNIPDFRGRTAIGVSADYAIGSSGGEEEHVLTKEEMPSHTHTQNSHNHTLGNHSHTVQRALGVSGTATWTGDQADSLSGSAHKYAYTSVSGTTIQTITATGTNNNNTGDKTATNNNTGGGEAHNNMQPYLTSNYIIKWKNTNSSQAGITVEEMADLLRPIGSIYETEDENFNPNNSWGGTWTSEELTNDFIVEEGVSGIWTYRKWSSGIAELWGKKGIGNVTINANGTYHFDWGAFPFQFAYEPEVNVNYSATSWIDICAFYTNAGVDAIDSYARNMANAQFSGAVNGYANVKGFWREYTAPTTRYKWTRIS